MSDETQEAARKLRWKKLEEKLASVTAVRDELSSAYREVSADLVKARAERDAALREAERQTNLTKLKYEEMERARVREQQALEDWTALRRENDLLRERVDLFIVEQEEQARQLKATKNLASALSGSSAEISDHLHLCQHQLKEARKELSTERGILFEKLDAARAETKERQAALEVAIEERKSALAERNEARECEELLREELKELKTLYEDATRNQLTEEGTKQVMAILEGPPRDLPALRAALKKYRR